MPTYAPCSLPENAGLAFVGERVSRSALIPPRTAARMTGLRNEHGKSNEDVLRRIALVTPDGRIQIDWQIDFPAEMDEREASLYALPFHHLYRTARPLRRRWWVNPHADAALRAALARRERYLAAPAGEKRPEFRWYESTLLPSHSLLVVARDDDFTHGVLSARPFALWWHRHRTPRTPASVVLSYPFPWPPGTGLAALTSQQEDRRHAVARAARGGSAAELETAVAAAYDWPAGLDDADLLARLVELHQARSR
jgi:hypothetical protein